MNTAALETMRQRDNELRAKMLETMMEAFYKRWAPPDDVDLHYDPRAKFSSELHMLIRQVYVDAQAPLLEQMTKLISVMPMHPLHAPSAGKVDEPK